MRTLTILLLTLPSLAHAAEGNSSSYVNVLSTEAARSFAKIAGRPVADLKTEAERESWAKARLAWVALARLQGRDAEARKIFAGCETICETYGPKEEWMAARDWACAKKPAPTPCAKSDKSKKTKH